MLGNILYFGITLLNSWLLNYSIASVTAASSLNTNFNEIVKLVNFCFSKSRLVGLISNPNNLPAFPNSPNSFLLLSTSVSNQSYTSAVKKPIVHEVDVYVLIVSSSDEAISVIQKLKSVWLNLEKPIIISTTDKSNATDNCKKALPLLSAVWKEDAVRAIFVCKQFGRTLLFTYNGFNGYPPDKWKLDNSQGPSRGVLFKQEYKSTPDTGVCRSLMYDKTINTRNYTINAVYVNNEPYIYIMKEGKALVKYLGVDSSIMSLMNRYLHVTPRFFSVNYSHSKDDLRDLPSLLPFLQSGEIDIIVNSMYNRNFPNVSYTYPIFWTGLSSVTRRRNHLSTLENIFHFMPKHIMLVLLMTGVLTHLILCYVFRDRCESAVSIVQLVLSTPIPQVPRTTPGRIFLSTILILFLITTSVFQGNLAKLLTVPGQKQNVEKLEDLNALDYNVIGDTDVKQLLGSGFHGNFTRPSTIRYYCHQLRENEAYIDDEFRLQCTSNSSICHVPRNYFLTIYKFYYVRSNWPLLPRVNRFLLTIFEHGVVHKIRDDVMRAYKAVHGGLWELPLKKPKPLELKNLWFAFELLLIGNLCALIVFLLEIAYEYYKRSTSKNWWIPQKT